MYKTINKILIGFVFSFSVFLFTGCYQPKQKEQNINKEKTAFQTASPWMPEIDVRSDIAIIYGTHDTKDYTFEDRVNSWKERGYQTHFMTGIAWGHYGDYFSGKWDGKKHWDAGQVNINGDTLWHNKGTVPYIVPVRSYIEYFKQKIIKKALDAGISSIYLEEPEFWNFGGYSEAFKKEWQVYYGFPWRPQHETPENAYLSNKLKYHLYYNAIDKVSRFAKEYGKSIGLNVKVYIPTHSLINYTAFRIVSPEASLASLPGIDGYIAQVWTGTARVPNYFNGEVKERVFESAFLEYGSMISMTKPTNRKIFLLTDPVEDWPRDWADYKKNYQATFTAMLLYPEVANYEVMPWPKRIYTAKYKLAKGKGEAFIPRYYSTQMQIMINSLNEMPVSDNRISGSHGIGVLMSNTIMLQRYPVFNGHTDKYISNFYGQTLPLLKRGIPVNLVHIENLSYSKTLKDIKVLIMSYSNMKPPTPEAHKYIADWVRNGGILIYCSKDDDPYQSVMEWWNTNDLDYSSPSEHLFDLLGIDPQTGSQKFDIEKGTVYVLRENPKKFVAQKDKDNIFIELIKKAYENDAKAGVLNYKNNFRLERGNYEIISVMDEGVTDAPVILKGSFINLFDPELPVITKAVVKPGEQAFLYNINKISNKNEPQVLASASRIDEEVINDREYSFISKSPLNTTNTMRLFLPDTPKKISVSLNNKKTIFEQKWDKKSKTLYLNFENNPEGIKVTILL